MQVRVRFGFVWRNPLRRSCASKARNAGEIAFWTGRPTFGGSLVRNVGFGDSALHFWRKSCTKRWLWRLGASLLEEISYEMLVLEIWRLTFGGSLVRNAGFGDFWRFTFGGSIVRNAPFGDLALHFWRKSRTKRSFWRFGASLLEEVSYETLILETWRFTCGAGLRSGQFVVQMHYGKELFGAGLRSSQFVVQM